MLELKSQLQTDRLDLDACEPSFELANKLFKFLKNTMGNFHLIDEVNEMNTPEDMFKFLIKQSDSGLSFLYAIKKKNLSQTIGFIVIHAYNKNNNHVQLSLFMIHEESVGRVCAEAITTVVQELFAAGCHKIKALIDASDQTSKDLYEISGFKLEAILKDERFDSKTHQYIDTLLYSVLNKPENR